MNKKVTVTLGIAAVVVAAGLIYNYRNLSIPSKARAVQDFEVKRYLGTWYEIARFDYRFEKDLERVTATYSLNDNGTVKVDNKGYDTVKRKWKQSIGTAKFIDNPKEGRLKVSFFKPFYSAYNILSIDGDYEHVLVVGQSVNYLWFLSRGKEMPADIREKYLRLAEEIGCETQNLIWVRQ